MLKISGSIKNFILFTIAILLSYLAHGQAHKPFSKMNLMADFKVEYGFLLSHHLELDKFQSHFPAFELSIEKQTHGRQRWESEYAYPIIGISAWYSSLGGFSQLGSAIAVFPFINFPLTKNNKQSLNFRLGVGVGYLTNYYQRVDNYQNFAIGSHFNVAGRLFFEYRRQISRLMHVNAGFGLTHFSNGSIKNPNYGLNMLTVTVSMSIYLNKPNPFFHKMLLPELYPFEFDGKKKLDVDFSFSLARKNMSQLYGQNFMVYAGYANLMKRISYKSAFGIGLDLVYDGSDKYILEWSGTPAENTRQLLKPGANVAYELIISQLSMMINFGFYLSGLERSEGDMYQRFSLRYRFAKNYFAQLALGTNFGKAEYVGFGLGYRFDFIYKRKFKRA